MAELPQRGKFEASKAYAHIKDPNIYNLKPPLPNFLVDMVETNNTGDLVFKETEGIKEIRIATIGNVDAGKCVSEDTFVVMADGSKRLAKNIRIGDKVMGENFMPSEVTEVHIGISQMYQIYEISEVIGYDENRQQVPLIQRAPLLK